MIKDTLKQIEEYRKLFFIETGSQILKIGTEEFEKNIKEEYLQAGFRVAKSLIIKVLQQLVEREEERKGRKNLMSKKEIPQAEWKGYEVAINNNISYLKSEIANLSTNIDKE
jgi:hypothetical protein